MGLITGGGLFREVNMSGAIEKGSGSLIRQYLENLELCAVTLRYLQYGDIDEMWDRVSCRYRGYL